MTNFELLFYSHGTLIEEACVITVSPECSSQLRRWLTYLKTEPFTRVWIPSCCDSTGVIEKCWVLCVLNVTFFITFYISFTRSKWESFCPIQAWLGILRRIRAQFSRKLYCLLCVFFLYPFLYPLQLSSTPSLLDCSFPATIRAVSCGFHSFLFSCCLLELHPTYLYPPTSSFSSETYCFMHWTLAKLPHSITSSPCPVSSLYWSCVFYYLPYWDQSLMGTKPLN